MSITCFSVIYSKYHIYITWYPHSCSLLPQMLFSVSYYRFVMYLSCNGHETFVHAVHTPAQVPAFFSLSISLCMDFGNFVIKILPQMF